MREEVLRTDLLLTGEMDASGALQGKANGWVSGAKKLQFQGATFVMSVVE